MSKKYINFMLCSVNVFQIYFVCEVVMEWGNKSCFYSIEKYVTIHVLYLFVYVCIMYNLTTNKN